MTASVVGARDVGNQQSPQGDYLKWWIRGRWMDGAGLPTAAAFAPLSAGVAAHPTDLLGVVAGEASAASLSDRC
jgi:hypothetical protein